MEDIDIKIISEWYQGCSHQWKSEDYVQGGTFLYNVTYCTECSVSFEKVLTPTLDGNFRDKCIKKLDDEGLDTYFMDYFDNKVKHKYQYFDNDFFFTTLATYLKEEKEQDENN